MEVSQAMISPRLPGTLSEKYPVNPLHTKATPKIGTV